MKPIQGDTNRKKKKSFRKDKDEQNIHFIHKLYKLRTPSGSSLVA